MSRTTMLRWDYLTWYTHASFRVSFFLHSQHQRVTLAYENMEGIVFRWECKVEHGMACSDGIKNSSTREHLIMNFCRPEKSFEIVPSSLTFLPKIKFLRHQSEVYHFGISVDLVSGDEPKRDKVHFRFKDSCKFNEMKLEHWPTQELVKLFKEVKRNFG